MNQKRRNIDQLQALFEETREPFIRFAYSYVRCWDTAEDIFMESITNFWQKYNGETTEDINPKSYLLTIVKNRSINYLRSQAAKLEMEEQIYEHQYAELNFRIKRLEECDPTLLFKHEIIKIIHQTLDSFSEQTNQIFKMSRFEQKTVNEIAYLLGITPKAVEYHITKTLKALRVALKDYMSWITFLLPIY